MLNDSTLDHAWIEQHILHQGSMCLLDRVEMWDEQRIQCRASSHRDVTNPLRAHGRLGAACGIEYAAQTMAVHGALVAPTNRETTKIGYLVSVRGTRLHVSRLDDIADDLIIVAVCATRSEDNFLYQFTVDAAGHRMLEGRAAVVLNAEAMGAVIGYTS